MADTRQGASASPVTSLPGALGAGKPLVTAWLGIPEPMIAGLIAREPGFDAVTLDMQHSPYEFADAARAIPLIAAAGKPAIVRVPVGGFPLASRLADAGASAIIAPMVNTVADAKAFAAHVKFPPTGERSWGPTTVLGLTGLTPDAYLKGANGFTLTFAMIETREALAIVDDILAVPGIDAIFIGPSDLSLALANGAALDPMGKPVTEALTHALSRARAAGKRAGIYAATGERAAEFVRLGFDLVALGSDVAFLRAGAAVMMRETRGG
jgi:4-hydroxy-2-oxoheptanedioate aldolase